MKIAILSLIAGLTANANAALSGYYDSAKKINVAISDGQVANSLKQEPISKVEVQGLLVTIETESCRRSVVLKAVPPARGMVGATGYEVESLSTDGCK